MNVVVSWKWPITPTSRPRAKWVPERQRSEPEMVVGDTRRD